MAGWLFLAAGACSSLKPGIEQLTPEAGSGMPASDADASETSGTSGLPEAGLDGDAATDRDGDAATDRGLDPVPARVDCMAHPFSSAGTTYYACDCQAGAAVNCLPGDDANSGTHPAFAWRTYEALRGAFRSLHAGDAVAFCRGGSFVVRADARWANPACTTEAPCVIRDYPLSRDPQDQTPRPIITASGVAVAFELGEPGTPDAEEGYKLLNLELRGDPLAAADARGEGVRVYNESADVLLCGLTVDRFGVGVSIPAAGGATGKNAHVRLQESDVTNNRVNGFNGACDNCSIHSNYFKNNGLVGSVIEIPRAASNMSITFNRIREDSMPHPEQKAIATRGRQKGVHIERNIIEADGPSKLGGIGLYVSGPSPEDLITEALVRSNRLIHVGGIWANHCSGCTFDNNLLATKWLDNAGLAFDTVDSSIRNNTLYVVGASPDAKGVTVISSGNTALANNLVVYDGSNASRNDWSCFWLGAPASYSYSDYNVCWFPRTPSGRWDYYRGNLAEWRAFSSLDAHSKIVDPEINLWGPDDDFSPASPNSPLVNAGDPAQSSPFDIRGRRRDDRPDIGAFELF